VPDGKRLVYVSHSSGVQEVYVRAFPDNDVLWRISNSGGETHLVTLRT
jgi:Tol biopolymer transport system component